MKIAPNPLNEELRLQDLYNYEILDSASEKEFDELLELASIICKCPIAAITFIDNDRQWLKSKIGISQSQVTRDIAFCSHTILQNEILQVKDTALDERFSSNPMVTDELFIRFYAGAPIVSATGFNLGSVCVIDQEPNELSQEQKNVLTILSHQVSKLLELRIKNNVLKKQSEEHIQYEKILLQKTLEKQESERSSISFELHENIAQCIAAAKFYLEIAEEATTNKNELIKKSKDMLVNLLYEVQDLSKLISPTTLKEVYLKESLAHLLNDFSKKNGITHLLFFETSREVNFKMALIIYRIVEEQLHNIKQHSEATSITVNLHIFESIFLTIKDNGNGVELNTFRKGSGLNKILSYVDGLNGTVDISGQILKGCALNIMIPLDKKEKEKQKSVDLARFS